MTNVKTWGTPVGISSATKLVTLFGRNSKISIGEKITTGIKDTDINCIIV